jgi:hypothetical protein
MILTVAVRPPEASMSAADVSAYLRAVAEAGLDRWAVGRFACGAVTEIKRGSSK